MTYLLDTNVLSETRKLQPAAGVAGWIAATPPDRLHLSAPTLGEIEQGIADSPRPGRPAPGFRPRALAPGCGDRVRRSGSPVPSSRSPLPGAVEQYAQPLPVIDALIAATARVHGMTVVTRNVKDFELAGVQVLNPFAE